MSANSNLNLKVSREIHTSPERVFDAWIEPAIARRWLFATPTGEMVRTEVNARMGGKFVFTERREGVEVEHVGEYLEVDRPRRLVFTFGVPMYSPEMTKVAIDIVPQAAGCEVTLSHENVLPEWRDRTREGWSKLLGNLAAALGD